MPTPVNLGSHKGYEMYFHQISYYCPALALYGYRSDTALKRAITSKLKKQNKH